MNAIFEEARLALHAVWHRRWLALAVAWGIALAGWLVISLIPNRYESQASIFVQMGSILPQQVGITANEQRADIDRVRQTLTSAENLVKVVKSTDLARQASTDRDMGNIVEQLQRNIDVKQQGDDLFTISAQATGNGFSDKQNAHIAREVVSRLIDIFVDQNITGNRDENSSSLKFLDAQLAERQTALQDAEQQQASFEQKYMGMLPGTGSIADRMSQARSQLEDVETSLAAANSSLVSVQSQMSGTPATVPGIDMGGGGGGARGRLTSLQGQLADMRAKGWTDAHPDVVAVQSQIASISGAASREVVTGAGSQPNPLYISLRSMLAERQATASALETRRAQIQSDMAQFAAKQAAAPEVVTEQAKLARDHDVLKASYDKLLQDREDVKLRSDVQAGGNAVQFRVVDPPSAPTIPVAPNRPLLLTLVLLAALAGGAAAAFGMAQLQTTYTTPAKLAAATGLPVIGAVTAVLGPKQRGDRRERMKWFAGAGAGLGGVYALLLVVELVRRALTA